MFGDDSVSIQDYDLDELIAQLDVTEVDKNSEIYKILQKNLSINEELSKTIDDFSNSIQYGLKNVNMIPHNDKSFPRNQNYRSQYEAHKEFIAALEEAKKNIQDDWSIIF